MKMLINAKDQDGMNVRNTLIFVDLLLDMDQDTFLNAVKKACTAYCKTKEGADTYQHNCKCFNWGDLLFNIPNDFLKDFGFQIANSDVSEIEVDFNEHLVIDDDLEDCDEHITL